MLHRQVEKVSQIKRVSEFSGSCEKTGILFLSSSVEMSLNLEIKGYLASATARSECYHSTKDERD